MLCMILRKFCHSAPNDHLHLHILKQERPRKCTSAHTQMVHFESQSEFTGQKLWTKSTGSRNEIKLNFPLCNCSWILTSFLIFMTSNTPTMWPNWWHHRAFQFHTISRSCNFRRMYIKKICFGYSKWQASLRINLSRIVVTWITQ